MRGTLALALVALAALTAVGTGCLGPESEPAAALEAQQSVAGAPLRLAARDPDRVRAAAAMDRAFASATEVADRVLADRAASEIDVLNKVPSHVSIAVSLPARRAIATALAVAEETEGAYDPTVPVLWDLWGLSSNRPRRPRDFEIDMALRYVDWTDVDLDKGRGSVRRLARRTRVDLGLVADGAIVDAALATLREAGVPAARAGRAGVDAVYGGSRLRPWWVTVRTGVEPGEGPVARIALLEGALATARPAVILETEQGEPVHALIDPRSGRPALALRLASVHAADGARAGGLAVAAFSLGGGARDMLSADGDLAGLLVGSQGRRWTSPGLRVDWQRGTGP